MAYELTSALSYFHHDLHLLHRDLKPQNVSGRPSNPGPTDLQI